MVRRRQAGIAQSIPCWAARIAISIRVVASLSPAREPELVEAGGDLVVPLRPFVMPASGVACAKALKAVELRSSQRIGALAKVMRTALRPPTSAVLARAASAWGAVCSRPLCKDDRNAGIGHRFFSSGLRRRGGGSSCKQDD